MDDSLSEDTQAVLLLCGTFGPCRKEKPLSLTEYTSLVRWLVKEELRPWDLLAGGNIGEAAKGSQLDGQRLESLLNRGIKLGWKVEEWQRNGIWIISRSDSDYPNRYKQHLKDKAPPLLFGVGDRALLKGGGLGIVGSRNVDEEGAAFTREVAELCARDTIPVVSGGARGVDQISMQAALEAGGITIGILAENLLKKSVERNARHAIAEGRLLLISPYPPESHFTVGNAMGRNKLIYALADSTLVVSAEYKKGGTWAGAEAELKRENPLPVFVRTGENVPQGNAQLLNMGATPCHEPQGLVQQLANLSTGKTDQQTLEGTQASPVDRKSGTSALSTDRNEQTNELMNTEAQKYDSDLKTCADVHKKYLEILPSLLKLFDSFPNSRLWTHLHDINKILNVEEPLLKACLKKAHEDGYIEKCHQRQQYRKKIIIHEQCSLPQD